ncbi:MAG: hypothetical protein EOO77_10815 [Oxalobacteraceae bacterium]|nr:MAG: hypothetical protein EOO77_10815 [Oxalobacteraceae bacterium]
MWCVPKLDIPYLQRMEDILELYERPVDPGQPVICLDEKPVVLHGDGRPCKRLANGSLRRDYEYRRLDTANIFCAIEPLTGRHKVKVTPRRDKLCFAEKMRDIARSYPCAKIIHCVMGNLNTHSAGALVKRFGENEGLRLWERFAIHYTPKHASWLNQAEIQISMLSRECLGKRRDPPSFLDPVVT